MNLLIHDSVIVRENLKKLEYANMIEFMMFSAVCLAIFVLANNLVKQTQAKSMKPIRIETEEEIRRKKLAQKQQEQRSRNYRD